MEIDGSTLAEATPATAVLEAFFRNTYSIASTADVDIMTVTLTAGVLYQIDGDGTSGNAYLRIFDRFGHEVKANDYGENFGEPIIGTDVYTQFIPNYDGLYYVAISDFRLRTYDPETIAGRLNLANPGALPVGTLDVSGRDPYAYPEVSAINDTAPKGLGEETDIIADEDRTLRVEHGAGSAIAAGNDVDIGRFFLLKGDVVVIDVNGEVDPSNVLAPVIRVFDENGVQLAMDAGSGRNADAELVFGVASGGAHFIGISGFGNANYNALTGAGKILGDTGSYDIILHVNPDLVGDSLANAIDSGRLGHYVVGLAGADTLNGNEGDDTLAGGDDNDVMTGGEGEDQLFGEFNDDTLDGGRGRDILRGGHGNDSLTGGAGGDTDMLQGDHGNDTLDGGKGADTLLGGAGDDSLLGGAGNNLMEGGDGLDVILGGTGRDTASGGAGADSLSGAAGNDSLVGGDGNDTLSGGSENDNLVGDAGDDRLLGGTGRDTLKGGAGNDVLAGGLDADIFDFRSILDDVDTVTDFLVGTDRIEVRGMIVGGTLNAGNLGQFVQVTAVGNADSLLAIDQNGLSFGASFTAIAEFKGITPAQLLDAANFLL